MVDALTPTRPPREADPIRIAWALRHHIETAIYGQGAFFYSPMPGLSFSGVTRYRTPHHTFVLCWRASDDVAFRRTERQVMGSDLGRPEDLTLTLMRDIGWAL